MLIYGDREEPADPEEIIRDIDQRINRLERMAPGLERHAALAALLVEAGKLLQGVADEASSHDGQDRRTAATDRLGAFLSGLANALCRSWDSDFEELGSLPRLTDEGDWPSRVRLRVPEGFAFYAVYPEAYIEAARRLKLAGQPSVIGIRSIGTSLGAVVAAAVGAPPPITVRPFGDPAARQIALDPALERELLAGDMHYLIVDEGPGRSGSSFGAVASWLRDRGIPEARIALLPSHCGAPGAAASLQLRNWWQAADREVGDFDGCWSIELERWCASRFGPLDEAPREISGGAWRALHFSREEDWPPVVPAWERRKFLLKIRGEEMLAKFAGLGRVGEEKLGIARLLHSEGLTAEPVALVHGFLVERWCKDAAPLQGHEKPLGEVARYIGTRARLLPAPSADGAGANDLIEMARRNVSLEFGRELALALAAWEPRVDELDRRTWRVRIDGSLCRHEWLRTESGALLKSDALDHHQAHDLIGCQDVAWDAAGAMIEFDVDQSCAEAFVRSIEEWAQRAIDRELLLFSKMAYLAFRLGQARLGATMVDASSEQQRLSRSGDRYALELQHLLESSPAATRPECPIG